MSLEHKRILICGEAYGETEEKEGKPFVGLAGKCLDGILSEVGLTRDECHITNVVNARPPNNNFSHYYQKVDKKTLPSEFLLHEYKRLALEIAEVKPNVVVALGNEAMKALLGFSGVMDYRGSILEANGIKVIPTIHPAAVMRNWSYRPAVVNDFLRIKEQANYPEVKITQRTLEVAYDYNTAIRYLDEISQASRVAFDIETEAGQITAIGFSHRLNWAVCIPFWFGSSGSLFSQEQELAIWEKIRFILESRDIGKIAHNASYDIGFIRDSIGIYTQNLYMDTMLAMHACYIELPKELAFVTSLYTDHPYYKYQIRSGIMDTYFRYNATDACLTYEVCGKLEEEMRELKVEGFYKEHIHSMIYPLLDMERKGVAFDVDKCKAFKEEYQTQVQTLQDELEGLVGHSLNVNSSKQMCQWLYDELKLPKQYNKDEGGKRITTDEGALDNLYKLSPNEGLKKVIEIRGLQKLISTYLDVKLDPDKRIRCNYMTTGTETGRLSSRTSYRGTGTNLQNIPNGRIKELFLADEGCVLINADLSQAEARVVAYLADETRLIKVFEEGGDIHRRNASNVFSKKESEVSSEERELAKRVVHASNYGMGPRTFAATAGIAESRAKQLLNIYFATYPRIKVWHMQIRSQLQRGNRVLTTPMGRKRVFFNRFDDSLFKEALAYIPQSTVADILNAGFRDCVYSGMDVRLQIHDAIVVNVVNNPEIIRLTIRSMKEKLERPIQIKGKTLIIPADFKVGVNWGEMQKWKESSVLQVG